MTPELISRTFQDAVDADDIDRAEAHVDRSRRFHGNPNAGCGPRFALIENDGLRAGTEIVTPVQRMTSARGRHLIRAKPC